MKNNLRDSLLIGSALITILACGFGLGRISPRDQAPVAPTAPIDSMKTEVVESLKRSLDLTADQKAEINPELESLSTGILDIRKEALVQYYQSLIDFQVKIAPKLSPRQQKLLEANRKLLEQEFANRFATEE